MTITEPGRLPRWTALVIAGAAGLSANAEVKVPADHHVDVGTFQRPESPARP
jgi:hypothetical protein